MRTRGWVAILAAGCVLLTALAFLALHDFDPIRVSRNHTDDEPDAQQAGNDPLGPALRAKASHGTKTNLPADSQPSVDSKTPQNPGVRKEIEATSATTRTVRQIEQTDTIRETWQEAYINGQWMKHGKYQSYYENGMSALTGEYANGMKSGRWVVWSDSDGRMVSECEYRDDQPDGFWRTWHENGQLAQAGRYEQGLRAGDWTTYEMNGRIESSGPYINGKKNGVWMNYDYDASEAIETVYKDDEAVSISRRPLK